MTQSPSPLAYATPLSKGPLQTLWRERDVLVAPTQIDLPARCVKCNAPEAQRFTRKAAWYPRWIFILIIPGVLIFAIVAMILQKKATYTCGLCETHAAKRRKAVAVAWMLSAAAVGLLILSIVVAADGLGRGARPLAGGCALLGVVTLIAALIYASVQTPILTPKKIDKTHAWYKGAGEAFLAGFPAQ